MVELTKISTLNRRQLKVEHF